MKIKELLEYLDDDQLIEIELNGLKSKIMNKNDISNEWLDNKVIKIQTHLIKGSEGYFFKYPDKSFVKIEIE